MSEGDVQRVIDALAGSLSGDQGTRENASKVLMEYANVPGYSVLLLETVANGANNATLRTAAASQFKHVVGHRYRLGVNGKVSENYSPISEEEKAGLRGLILNALVTDILPVRNLLEDALSVMVELDYPEKWAELPDLILGALQAEIETPEQIFAALVALRSVIRRFDRSDAALGDRKTIVSVADTTFPILKSLLEYLLEHDSAQSQEVIVLLLKVVWDGSIYGLPNIWLQDHANFEAWMQLMIRVFHCPVPMDNIEHVSQLQKLPWFQAKKWVMHFWIRLSSRFLRSSAKRADDPAEFVDYFNATFPPIFLEQSLQVLADIGQGRVRWPERCITTLFDFVHTCVSISSLWQQLKPHIWDIVRTVFIPLLSFTEEDANLFEYEPEFYIANQLDPLANENDPRTVILVILHDLAKYRESIWLQELMLYISTELLRPYANTPEWTSQTGNYVQDDPDRFMAATLKYAGISIFGALRELIFEEPEYFGAIEEIISLHVLPDLVSGPAWLRAKACWAFARYCKVSFNDDNLVLNGLEGVLRNVLTAEEMPLVAEAATALYSLVSKPFARPIIGPVVPQLVEKYLALMSRLDNEAIVNSLHLLMHQFPKLMRRSAAGILSNLTQAFLKASHNSDQVVLGDDTDTDAAFMAASSTVQAVRTLYRAMHNSPNMYASLEPYLIPILDTCLAETNAQYLEDILELCTEVSYHTPVPFSQDLWDHMFMAIAKAYLKWAPDYMQQMLCTFDNFLSRDPQNFLAGPYLEKICSFAQAYFTDPKYPELDLLPLTRLFEALLLEHTGAIDHIIEPLIKLTVDRIAMPGSVPIKTALLQIILNAFYYNAELTVNILETHGWTAKVLKMIFDYITSDAFERVCDKKVASLGIGALLRLPMAAQPPYVQEKYLEIVTTWMQLTQQAEEQRISEMDQEEDGEEGDYDDVEFEDDEDGPLEGGESDIGSEMSFTDDEEFGRALDDDDDDDGGFGDEEAQMAQAFAMMKQQALEEGEDLDPEDYAALAGENAEEEGHIYNRGDHEDLNDGFGPIGNAAERVLDAELYQWTLKGQEFSEELPTDDVHEIIFLAETLENLEPAVKEQLLGSFTPEMHELFEHLMTVATDKAEKVAFDAERKAAKEAKRQELREYHASLKAANNGL